MDEGMKIQCEDAAFKWSLVFATFGLLAALLLIFLMFGLDGITDLFSKFQTSIITAVVALYAAAACLGSVAGRLICRLEKQDPRIGIIGIGLAWGCLLVSALAGSSILFFREMGNPSDVSGAFKDYIIKPVFWVMFFGIIPALVFGLLYGAQVKKSLGEG